jgi:hypothetical protein
MKRNCLLLLLLCFPFFFAAPTLDSSGSAQTPTPADFPAEILQGMDNFNLAIDVYGDVRGNFGPCG